MISLCGFSGLKPLSKVFKKLRTSQNLNIVIRRYGSISLRNNFNRVERKREVKCLVPAIYRLVRLKNLRIEFPRYSFVYLENEIS